MEVYLLRSWLQVSRWSRNRLFSVNDTKRIHVKNTVRWEKVIDSARENILCIAEKNNKFVFGSCYFFGIVEGTSSKDYAISKQYSTNISWHNFIVPLQDDYFLLFPREDRVALFKEGNRVLTLPFTIKPDFPFLSWSMFSGYVEARKNNFEVFVLCNDGTVIRLDTPALFESLTTEQTSYYQVVAKEVVCFAVTTDKKSRLCYLSTNFDLFFNEKKVENIAAEKKTSKPIAMATCNNLIIVGTYQEYPTANHLFLYSNKGKLSDLSITFQGSTSDLKDIKVAEITSNFGLAVVMRIYHYIDLVGITKNKLFLIKKEITARDESNIVNHGMILLKRKRTLEAICCGDNFSICSVFIELK